MWMSVDFGSTLLAVIIISAHVYYKSRANKSVFSPEEEIRGSFWCHWELSVTSLRQNFLHFILCFLGENIVSE